MVRSFSKEKTSKFEWMLRDIRIEKIISAPISAMRFQLYYMLEIIPSSNLVQYQGKLMMQP